MSTTLPTAVKMIDVADLEERDAFIDDAEETAPTADDVKRKVRSSVAGAAIAAVPFLAVLWNFSLRPLRSALPNRLFSDFFDIQSRAFLAGDLALPDGAIGFEAFRHGGHEYMYFGAWPSLLRLPVLALTSRLDGRLSAPSMLLAWLSAALVTCLLVWRVRAQVAPDRPVSRTEATAMAMIIAVTLGGSPVLIVAAMPWVYSEALLWAVAASLGALYGAIGVLERPTRARIAGAGAMTLVAVLCRVTAGWGCALTMLAVGLLLLMSPRFAASRSRALWVCAAGAGPLAIGIAINYAKFGHPILIPFENQIWTELSQRRRDVLDQGGVTGVRFLPATVLNYLRPDGLRFSPIFPFITAPGDPAGSVGGTMLEMPYRTPSATSLMPLLFGFGAVGAWRTFRRRADAGSSLLRVPLIGAASILGGIMFVGYVAPRYTVEFVPVLLIASAAGLTPALDRAFALIRSRRLVLGVVGALAAYGMAANVAVAMVVERVGEAGGSMRGLVAVQHAVSELTGRPLDRRVDFAGEVPRQSDPERILILGDCDLVLVGTGEWFEPWVPVEMRSVHVDVVLGDRPTSGGAVLVDFAGSDGSSVTLEVLEFHYRLVVTGTAYGYWSSEWRTFEPGTRVQLDVNANFDHGAYNIESQGLLYASRYVVEYGQDAVAQFVEPRPVRGSPEQNAIDIDVEVTRGESSALCRDLSRSG